jgi:hypothetical protein
MIAAELGLSAPKCIRHHTLVQHAVRWLRNSRRCGVVLAEASGGHYEPDAIGWTNEGFHNIVVECKRSRSDFRADRKKLIHNDAVTDLYPGHERIYFTPKGLVKAEEVPEGWGLVELRGTRVYWVKRCPELNASQRDARRLAGSNYLYSAMRKLSIGRPFLADQGRFGPMPGEEG